MFFIIFNNNLGEEAKVYRVLITSVGRSLQYWHVATGSSSLGILRQNAELELPTCHSSRGFPCPEIEPPSLHVSCIDGALPLVPPGSLEVRIQR